MEITTLLALLGWGTWVSLDLVSVGQVMIARPLVAGVVAGGILGDLQTGFMVGTVLELFALELLPFGAARYPDYGVGTVAAVATAAGAPGLLGLGLGVTVGLLVAFLGERAIQLVRERTTVDVRRHLKSIDAGDRATIHRLHRRGLVRDGVRGLALTALGLGLAGGAGLVPAPPVRSALLLTAVAIGIGLGTAGVSVLRVAGDRRAGFPWLAVGLAAGVAWVFIR
jgi:mannose/fructose/N-acetylgalactosamine-specific phosphotransferase system component IIC